MAMDILNEETRKMKKPNRIVWFILLFVIIILLLFQFVNFAPASSEQNPNHITDSVSHRPKTGSEN